MSRKLRPSTLPAPSLGENLLELADRLRETYTRAVAAEGLTFMEGRLLRLVLRTSDQADVVAALRIAPSSVSAMLTKLERLGYVTREPSTGDRRHRRLAVTPTGDSALRRVFERLDRSSPIVTELDDAELGQFKGLVDRLLAGFDRP